MHLKCAGDMYFSRSAHRSGLDGCVAALTVETEESGRADDERAAAASKADDCATVAA